MRTDRAIAALAESIIDTLCGARLVRAFSYSPHCSGLYPMFDPLRHDPRFQKLAARLPAEGNNFF